MTHESWSRSAYDGKQVLVTGGLGFIGSNLALRLLALGAKVRVLDVALPEGGANPFNLAPAKGEIEILEGDIGDVDLVSRALAGCAHVFNLAGTLAHADSMRDPLADLHANCTAHVVLLEALRRHAPEARIVYTGTRGQYGKPRALPVDEDHPLVPADANGVSKTAGENYHLLFARHYGIRAASLRLSNTYGPRHQMRHPRQGVLNWFVRKALDGETIPIYGDGSQIRDLHFVSDVVEALLLACASDRAVGKSYNLGGEALSLKQVAELLTRLEGKGKIELLPYPAEVRSVEVGDFIADRRRIREELGWEPEVNAETGFTRTLEYYREHRSRYW